MSISARKFSLTGLVSLAVMALAVAPAFADVGGALVNITGRDFGYSPDKWTRWTAQSRRTKP